MRPRAKILGLFVGAISSACSQLPVDGPNPRDIARGATATLQTERGAIGFDYALIDLTPAVVEFAVPVGPGSFFTTFGAGHGPAPEIRVGVGDVVQVSVFESAAGGLFIPSEAGVRPGNFVTLPAQTIDRTGNLSVPYAGQIHVVGRSTSQIQHDIESKLANRAIEPQVVVTLVEQNATEVSVVGDGLTAASKLRIRPAGERILDIVSRSGGVRYPGYELFVTLQRNNRRATVYFPTLVNNPQENIFVAPGDTLYVFRETQKFVAVGALASVGALTSGGLTSLFTFDQEQLSLNEAVARAGGLLDSRASPQHVYLYRAEYRDALVRMGVDLSAFNPDEKLIPTIYRANFRDPSSFFLAQKFAMRHKDIIYVANAEAVEVDKFLAYVSSITSTTANVAVNGTTVRDIWRGGVLIGPGTRTGTIVSVGGR
jgi:polysaccharide export outer membrane protein